MKYSFFYFSILSFIIGTVFCSLWDLGFYFGFFWIFLSIMVWLLVLFIGQKTSDKKFFLFISLLMLFFGIGLLRCSLSNETQQSWLLDNLEDQNVSVTGIVMDEPDERENNTKLVVKILSLENLDLNKTNIKMLLTVQHYPQFEYGDEIKFSGVLQKPKNFFTDGGREFDYVRYLSKDNIFYQIFYPEVNLVSGGNGNFVKEKLFSFKKVFLGQIKEIIPEPQLSLLGGLLVGAKQSLGQDLQDDFRKVGLIHIVVLSGYNVAIIAGFIMSLFSFFPRIIGMSLGALSIVLFAVMVGGSATIVRASIMALLVIFARATGRVNDMTRALFLAGFVMVLHNPNIVVFDPSFQLSFMATLGLILLAPKLDKFFKFVPEKFYLRETVLATISTQIFVLPLLLYMMGELSIVAVFVNLLVLMFIPLTMLFGFLTGMFVFISTWLALPFSYITQLLLSYELKVVEIFASLPFASIKVNFFPFYLMVIVYCLYFLLLRKFTKQSEEIEILE
ncbi:MAG: ComEC/Rec2 family competence protein [Patescibacteria group bacterium]|nr:ComEC/Rec2 family competence protein [Patescibacteria group bacterium]